MIHRHAPMTGTHQTLVPSLTLMHATQLTEPLESVYKPSICVVAQGAKMSILADESYRYDPSTYFINSVELPVISKVIEASPEIPYLSLKLSFEIDVILDIVQAMDQPTSPPSHPTRGITLNRMSLDLLEAIVRLVHLLDKPADIPILSPLIIREILYRVLQSEQGASIQQFAVLGSQAHNIAQVIRHIVQRYDQPLEIEQLAKSINMSTSAFHKHFKRVTAMSPLQYLKTIRLQNARNLMLSESLHASDAAFRVGYESPSQFSREYARMYGRPPMLDIQELRSSVSGP
nr:AraC family transcriptional regulator [Paenibacillus cellulosilyticus]